MGRLVVAILILLGVLLGLRLISTPGIRQFLLNRIGGAPPTATTGFNTPVPSNVSENTPLGPTPAGSTATAPQTTAPGTGTPDDTGTPGVGTGTPTETLRPIPGGW